MKYTYTQRNKPLFLKKYVYLFGILFNMYVYLIIN